VGTIITIIVTVGVVVLGKLLLGGWLFLPVGDGVVFVLGNHGVSMAEQLRDGRHDELVVSR
jgi:hypothetical protein